MKTTVVALMVLFLLGCSNDFYGTENTTLVSSNNDTIIGLSSGAGMSSSLGEITRDGNSGWIQREEGDLLLFSLAKKEDREIDSVRMIVHPSGKGVAMVVDSARFARFENCDMYLNASSTIDRSFMKEIMEPLHQLFLDSFDFAVFINNIERRGDCGYRAAFKNLKNTTEGIGKQPWNFEQNGFVNNRYQGYIHIPQRNYLLRGPILHEIVHNWSNYVIESSNTSHWGTLGVGGYLGGWDPQTLVEVDSGTYCAAGQSGFKRFATGGVANNMVQYAPLELYLMGLLPSDSVPDVVIPQNFRYSAIDTTRSCFTADTLVSLTIDDIIAENGVRVPEFGSAPTQFSVMFILVSPAEPTGPEWELVLSTSDTLISKDTLPYHRQNFYSATEGRGELQRHNLIDMVRGFDEE
ncbi:MAG: hypothetical protein OCD01_06055 [Fibrobacterales bacterium]